MDRPMTSQGGPRTATSSRPFTANPEAQDGQDTQPVIEEDDDEGMFSFLAPTQPSSHVAKSPSLPSHINTALSHPTSAVSAASGVSPAAAYAAHFIKNDQELANTLAKSRRSHGLQYDESGQYIDDPFGSLSASQAVEGYTVHSPKAPVIQLASRLKQATANTQASDGSTSPYNHSHKNSQDGDEISPSSAQQHHILLDPAQARHGEYEDIHSLSYSKEGGMDTYEAYASKMKHLETFDGTDPMELLDELIPEEEDSPFPEVRASVSNIDDPEMPCLTFRSWVIGLVLTCFCAGLNLFFQLRYPSPFLTPILIQIIAYPIGKAFATVLPMTSFPVPGVFQRWFGWDEEWSLNPGPFNIKEHTVIVIMANSAISPAYALNLTLILDKYYNLPKGIGFDICVVISSQMVGYGFAGLCRRFLVWPAGMIWPSNLVICTLLNTFHAEEDDGRDGSMTRFRFFAIVAGAAFVWYFLPNFLFQALSFFSWVCWIWPDNIIVNQLFGVWTGLGMGLFTFDWGQIAYIGSPLITPWWAIMNVFAGFLFFYWFLTPILYYANFWFFSYMPMFSVDVYDRFGEIYDVQRVVDANYAFNTTAYGEYSPLYMPATYVSVYCIAFALSTAAIVHTILYHGKSIVQKLRSVRTEAEDVHAKLMRNYPEVPDWWYGVYTILMFALGVVAIEVFDTGLPVWGLVLALSVSVIYILPGGFIFAMTSQQITLNLLAELIPGYLLPGRPIAVMAFKSICVQALGSGLTFTQDLKLGHYMKLPPRITFTVQIVCGILSCLVQIGTKEWLVRAVPDLCSDAQADKAFLVCPQAGVFYTSSIIWGLIGPKLSFSVGHLYHPMLYFTIIGAVLPIPIWLATRKWPRSWLRYINTPVLFTGASYIPPGTGINYVSWFIVGFIFQFWMRRHRFRWWSKFNFVLSASLEGGTLLSGIFIFLTLQLPKHGSLAVKWWGNEVFTKTADWTGPPYRTPPADGWGPTTWTTT